MKLPFACCRMGAPMSLSESVDACLPRAPYPLSIPRIAPVYDLWGILTESRARRSALELADIQDGRRLLEVAVGTGLAFEEMVRRNPRGTNLGIDLSPGMLEQEGQTADGPPPGQLCAQPRRCAED